MKSKITVRQQLHLVPQILKIALASVVILLVLSGSLLAQRRKAAAPAKPASTQTYSCVPFEEVKFKDYDSLVKAYPFLKEDSDGTTTSSENSEDTTSSVDPEASFYFSDLRPNGIPQIVFIHGEDRDSCGASNCLLEAYMVSGKGLKPVLSILAPFGSPVYISQDHSSLLISFNNGRGGWGIGEMKFKNNEFQDVDKPRRFPKLPKCGERPIWNPAANNPITTTSSNAQKLAAGSWRDENSLTTYNADGTAISKFDSGVTAKGTWSINGDLLTTVWVEVNGKRLEKPKADRLQILELTREKFVSKGPDGKEWHAVRVK